MTKAYTLLALGLLGCQRVPQAESCRAFVACARALDARSGEKTNLARYEADGECWGNGEAAELCEGSCDRGLVQVVRTNPSAPAECRP